MTQDEYAEMLSQAKEQFKQGTPLFGKNGAFHRVLEDFLNSALECEMDSHLYNSKTSTKSNRRNGKMSKEVQTEYGPVEIDTPRDREGSFTPEIIKKRQTILAEGLSDKIISLYATGQSMSDISKFLEENYGTKISKETISNDSNLPMEFVNATLLSVSDSAFITGTTTDSLGMFIIPNTITNGIIKVSYIGCNTQFREIVPEDTLYNFFLQPNESLLKEVVVKGRTYLHTAKGIIENIASGPLAKLGNGLDVLSHLPFIINKNGNISVLGKGKPLIFIIGVR